MNVEQPQPHTLDAATFEEICRLIYDRVGITLNEKKEALVQARLGKRLRTLGLTSYRDYIDLVNADESGEEITHLVDAITTNVTHFFRENHHFEFLATTLKPWAGEKQDRFRIWCAAAATGEEPYSIAITVLETLGDRTDTRILATDISTRALAEARAARYPQRDTATVSDHILKTYFSRLSSPEGAVYEVNDRARQLVTFARLNLSTPPFPMKGPFDVIFCRNVMIYFDNTVRKRLLDNCYGLLRPGGYLLVDHAKSLSGMLSNFKFVAPAIYVKA